MRGILVAPPLVTPDDFDIIYNAESLNAANFLPNLHKIHPIAHPLGRDIGCNLWFDTDLYSASVNAVLYDI